MSIEKTLFEAADKMRGAMDAGEYKHVALGLLFLRYVSAAFELKRAELLEDDLADPEDPEEYLAESVFWVPEPARWSRLQAISKSPEIGVEIDNAMRAIEETNPTLQDALPKVFGRESLDRGIISGLIALFSNMKMQGSRADFDLIGRIYEYCIGEFASSEGKRGGEFYTPKSVVAGYHQFHAVRKGLARVVEARESDGRGGVIWHTQGSGKSLLMAFLGGALMHEPALANPTLVVLTDRNDLDQQLFTTFARCAALFGEDPMQAEDIDDLRAKLAGRRVGGIIFTTIQKFRPKSGEAEFPELTDRSNVIIFVDKAHRSQYGKLAAGTPEADATKEEVGLFLAVPTAVIKLDATGSAARAATAADFAIGQLVNQAVASTEIVDILAACGLDRPDIAVLSDEFLAELQQMKQKNLAVEALKKLLNGEIAARTPTNVREARGVLRAPARRHRPLPQPKRRRAPGDPGADRAREVPARRSPTPA